MVQLPSQQAAPPLTAAVGVPSPLALKTGAGKSNAGTRVSKVSSCLCWCNRSAIRGKNIAASIFRQHVTNLRYPEQKYIYIYKGRDICWSWLANSPIYSRSKRLKYSSELNPEHGALKNLTRCVNHNSSAIHTPMHIACGAGVDTAWFVNPLQLWGGFTVGHQFGCLL